MFQDDCPILKYSVRGAFIPRQREGAWVAVDNSMFFIEAFKVGMTEKQDVPNRETQGIERLMLHMDIMALKGPTEVIWQVI